MKSSTQSIIQQLENLETTLATTRVLVSLTRTFYGRHSEKVSMMTLIENYITFMLDDDGLDQVELDSGFWDNFAADDDPDPDDPPTPSDDPDMALH